MNGPLVDETEGVNSNETGLALTGNATGFSPAGKEKE